MEKLIAYLVILVIVLYVIALVIGAIIAFGIFILAGIAGAGMIGGLIKGTMNFFEVLKEAHDKLP